MQQAFIPNRAPSLTIHSYPDCRSGLKQRRSFIRPATRSALSGRWKRRILIFELGVPVTPTAFPITPFPPSSSRALTRVDVLRLFSLLRSGPFARFPEYWAHSPGLGPFLEAIVPLWLEFTVLDIPSARSSIGCCSITLSGSWPSMKAASRRSMASSDRLSRKSSSATLTAATRAAGLPA